MVNSHSYSDHAVPYLWCLLDSSPTNQLVVSQELYDSWTSQLAKLFDAKFGVNNSFRGDMYTFAVGELTSPWVIWLTMSWFVSEYVQ